MGSERTLHLVLLALVLYSEYLIHRLALPIYPVAIAR